MNVSWKFDISKGFYQEPSFQREMKQPNPTPEKVDIGTSVPFREPRTKLSPVPQEANKTLNGSKPAELE